MKKQTQQHNAQHKSLIYLNLALALLLSSNTRAAGSDADFPHPQDSAVTKTPTTEKNIKVIYDKTDSLSAADIAQIQQNITATGVDIRYHNGFFTLRQDNRCTDFFLEELDYDGVINRWQQHHDSVHAQPVKFNIIQVSAEYYLRDAKARYIAADNEVFIRVPTEKRKSAAIKRLRQNTDEKLSRAEADSIISAIIKMGQNKDFIRILAEHELSHAEDWENGIFKPDISLKRFTQLSALTEIKASMTEAGLALQFYKETGDLSHFAYVNPKVDTLALQNDLRTGKGKENPELYVAKYMFDKWLEKYNHPGTEYMYQLSVCASIPEGKLLQNIADSPEIYREYLQRVRLMFANIKGLGNVNQIINPDFELHPQLLQQINEYTNGGFMPLMPHRSAREDLENIKSLLLIVRDIDQQSRHRSSEEQETVNKAIKSLQKTDAPQTYNMAQHILSAKVQEK